MRFAALVERLPDGRWRAWVPALPDVQVTSATSTAAEEDLAHALEAHVRAEWAAGAFAKPAEVRAFTVEIRSRAMPRRGPPGEADRARTLARLDALLSDGERLPSFVVDAVFRYRREMQAGAPEEPLEPEPEGGLPENVRVFVPRER